MKVDTNVLSGESIIVITSLVKQAEVLKIATEAIDFTIRGLIKASQNEMEEGIIAFQKAGKGLVLIVDDILQALDKYAEDPETGGAVVKFIETLEAKDAKE